MAKSKALLRDEAEAKQGIVELLQQLLAHLPEDWYISLGLPGVERNLSGGSPVASPNGAAFSLGYWIVGPKRDELDHWYERIIDLFVRGGSEATRMENPANDPIKDVLIRTPGEYGVRITRGPGTLAISVTSPPYPEKTARTAPPMPFDIYRDRVVQN